MSATAAVVQVLHSPSSPPELDVSLLCAADLGGGVGNLLDEECDCRLAGLVFLFFDMDSFSESEDTTILPKFHYF